MSCPSADKWNLLAMEVLEGDVAEGMRAHARVCVSCRERYQMARREHAERIRMYEAFDRDHDELREQLMAALPDELPPAREGWLARAGNRLGGLAMSVNNSTTRRAAALLAPAACIVIAIVVLLGSPSGVAFAVVLERMREARTMVCEVALTMRIEVSELLASQVEQEDGTTPMASEHTTRGKLSMYSDGVTRAWLLEQSQPAMRQLTLSDRMIMTEDGRHSVIKISNDPNAAGFLESPEAWLQRLLALTEEPDRQLGEQLIDGREVVGFGIAASRLNVGLGQVADEPGSVIQVWVDVETHLPLRLEFDVVREVGPIIMRLTGTWDQLQWDVPLDPEMFTPPEITETDEVKDLGVPAATEEALLAGLRVYAEQSAHIATFLADAEEAAVEKPGGAEMLEQMRKWIDADSGYPAQLDLQSIGFNISMRTSMLRAYLLADRAKRAEIAGVEEDEQQRAAEDEQYARDRDEFAKVVMGAAMFYQRLVVEGREPEYFGDVVTPEDPGDVLLRWRLDDGQVRVIYGDLRVETLSAADDPEGSPRTIIDESDPVGGQRFGPNGKP